MDKYKWLDKNTFHYSYFNNLANLVEEKNKKNLSISLVFPTLNEEKSIAKEIVIMKAELMDRYPLLDEILVIDSNSTDNTVEIARKYGADVYLAEDILPQLPKGKGKGENLWKALYVAKGDIIVYIDADIKNIHHRFVYGLLGPLILEEKIKYSKAFYNRPISSTPQTKRPARGGRVTELVTRPLFSMFFPELSQIIQPLSGEYAGYREIFENVSFPLGYGIETSLLIDIYKKWGLDVIAQVDLDKRIHRNQDTLSLGRMSFGIMQTFVSRASKFNILKIEDVINNDMIQFDHEKNEYIANIHSFDSSERPPMMTIDDYKLKFHSS